MRTLGRYLLAAIVLIFSRRRRAERREERREPPRDDRKVPASARAEAWTAGLLFGAGLAGLAFVAVYAFDEANTQLLGASIAVALALLAAALILAAAQVVPQETLEEERPPFTVDGPEARLIDGLPADRLEDVGEAERTLVDAGEGVTRRRLLGAAGTAAGVGIGAAALAPLASLGPAVGDRLSESPWKDGTRLVEENGMAVKAADLEVGSFLTAFAQGVDKENLAASLAVVRVKPDELELPDDRADWAPEGLLAFSKICTHAQCAISLFRYPVFAERSPGPALVCPCHYSTFDVLKGGERIFGPAVRALPQLPLRIEGGELVAAGPLSGAVGSSWSRVREEG
jgi:ubiquinol-cytochrome c reductase iron-sulfur subunit